jgi:hypothetical protein
LKFVAELLRQIYKINLQFLEKSSQFMLQEIWLKILFLLNSRQKDLGGGTILDLGVYAIQFAQFVFRDEPVSVSAKGKLNENGVDVETEVELKYKNGGVARFKTSALEELSNKANVRGSENFMTVSLPFCESFVLKVEWLIS